MSDARDYFGYKRPDDEAGSSRGGAGQDDPQSPPLFDEAITLTTQPSSRGIDTADMVGRVRELPRDLALARRVAAAVELPASHRAVDAVCVLAMGGSAIGLDRVAGIAGSGARAARRPPRLRAPGLDTTHGHS